MSDAGSAISGASLDLGKGITGIAQVGAGALMLLVGFLLLTGWSKAVTRVAKQTIPIARLVR
jgi:hypothetical protein